MTAGSTGTVVKLDLDWTLGDTGGYPPNGIPTFAAPADVYGTVSGSTLYVSNAAPVGAGWGLSAYNRIGIFLFSTQGVSTGPIEIQISNIRVLRKT